MRLVGGSAIKKDICIDAGNLIHRAFYVLTKNNNFSFPNLLNNIINLVSSYIDVIGRHGDIYVFFDGIRVSKKELHLDYKGNRKKKPIFNLDNSIYFKNNIYGNEREFLIECLKKIGIKVFRKEEYEADDLIYHYCRNNESNIKIIISDDKDFFPLLEDNKIIIYRPSQKEFVDADRSIEIWKNLYKIDYDILPKHVKMFKALCGDASDNIKGIHRIQKSALQKYVGSNDLESLEKLCKDNDGDRTANLILNNLELLHKNIALLTPSLIQNFDDCLEISDLDIIFVREYLELQNITINLGKFVKELPMSVLPDWYKDL